MQEQGANSQIQSSGTEKKVSAAQLRALDFLSKGYWLEILTYHNGRQSASLCDKHHRHSYIRKNTALSLVAHGLVVETRKYLSGKHGDSTGFGDVWCTVYELPAKAGAA